MTTQNAVETVAEDTAECIVEVVYAEYTDSLFHRYPGQSDAQDCFVWLDCEAGRMGARYNAEIGNAVPSDVHHGHTRRFEIPRLRGEDADTLLNSLLPLAERVVAGYSSEWDGSNHIAVFDEDATAALAEMESLCASADGDTIEAIDAADERIDEIAEAQVDSAADGDEYWLDQEDVARYLRRVRDDE